MKLSNHKPDNYCGHCYGRLGNKGMICIDCAAGCCLRCARMTPRPQCRCMKFFPRRVNEPG